MDTHSQFPTHLTSLSQSFFVLLRAQLSAFPISLLILGFYAHFPKSLVHSLRKFVSMPWKIDSFWLILFFDSLFFEIGQIFWRTTRLFNNKEEKFSSLMEKIVKGTSPRKTLSASLCVECYDLNEIFMAWKVYRAQLSPHVARIDRIVNNLGRRPNQDD